LSVISFENGVSCDLFNEGLIIMSECVIVDISTSVDPASSASNSYLLYKNLLDTNISNTVPAENADSAGVTSLYDGNTNLKFKCLSAGVSEFDFTLPLAVDINSMAVAGADLLTSGVVWEFFVWDADLSSFVKVSEGSGKKDNSPIFNVFDTKLTNRIKFRFTTTSPVSIGELGVGNALRFPVPPSIGYQPARWSNNNVVNIGRTENNTLSSSTVLNRGSSESVKFDKIEADWIDDNFIDVLDYKGLPVWFVGDQKFKPNSVVFGNWESSTRPSYESAFRSSISLNISGAV
jgi:hypothetical protein